MEQWQAYSDPAGAGGPRRYNGSSTSSQMSPRDYGGGSGQNPAQQQPPAGFKYENYQGGLNPHQTPSSATSPMASPHLRDGNGDVPMPDSHDSYSGLSSSAKYPMRPHHQHHLSSGRAANLQQEPSAAAQRYSPMEVMSPTSPYGPKTGGASQFSQQPAQRQSPTRSSDYAPQQSPYYSSRQAAPQLPPINPYGNNQESYSPSAMTPMDGSHMDPKSPKRAPPQSATQDRGPVPEFRRIRAPSDLKPKVNDQPPFRRANPEGGFISPLQALTVQLPATYRICNPGFKYESSRNPRRVLTKPSKGVKNDGYDNEDSDYILYVNDILGSEEAGHKNRYLILDVLGQGTFGQVVKCQNMKTQEVVAVKVIKNRTAYFNQSMMEVSVLDLLNTKLDKNDDHHLLRLKDTFIHRQHLCLVFELLSVNLYELIKQNQFRGLSTTLVRVFAQQLLNGLALLNKARLIHCDLKPENILLKNLESPIIKIIDFGSACDERQTVYTYIQSRFYRSPEVLLGLPYSSAIDMWSLGCIVVELFLGLPLFPGSSEYNQVSRIVEMLGNPPNWMIEMGKQAGEFFEKRQDEFGRRTYHLKSMEQYSRERGVKEQPSKKYFQANTLPEIIKSYPMPRKNMKQSEIDREMNNRIAFIDFVRGLLTINPLERWSPQQAKLHPFITQQKYTGQFVPPMNLKASALNRSPAPGTQQQIQAEALSKQRAQAAQAQAQASTAAQGAYGSMGAVQYQQQPHAQQQPLYGSNNMYTPTGSHSGAPPPYSGQQGGYGQMGMAQAPVQMPPANYAQSNMYAQQNRARPRASTMEQQQSGIPAAIQRVASHLDPNQPIRLQPSPAYYPPPPEGLAGMDHQASNRQPRRGSRAQQTGRGNRDFIRNLEERTLEEGFMGSGQSPWH
ncbi:kinase-like domain-containing protein [Corynascus novoguineensis]|uniref:Kinase-like domain-containing protein n=1 Tax=Corynascus novoguineensis TaxID=1126955 RepID=A0AAN7HHV8_9PEZI|nr:kinase-like domain-containing protein [Corynascus novoguineensis]